MGTLSGMQSAHCKAQGRLTEATPQLADKSLGYWILPEAVPRPPCLYVCGGLCGDSLFCSGSGIFMHLHGIWLYATPWPTMSNVFCTIHIDPFGHTGHVMYSCLGPLPLISCIQFKDRANCMWFETALVSLRAFSNIVISGVSIYEATLCFCLLTITCLSMPNLLTI